MSRTEHSRGEIQPPDGVRMVDIEPGSGLLWRSGCGVQFREAFLAGTEPGTPCRRRIEKPPIFIEFEEPAVISEEQSEEWSTEIPGMGEVQVVIDPSALPPVSQDEDPDVLDEKEREAVDRAMEEAARRAEEELERLRKQLPQGSPVPLPPEPREEDDDREDDLPPEQKEEKDEEKEKKKEKEPPHGDGGNPSRP
jgi:hypothetical protein